MTRHNPLRGSSSQRDVTFGIPCISILRDSKGRAVWRISRRECGWISLHRRGKRNPAPSRKGMRNRSAVVHPVVFDYPLLRTNHLFGKKSKVAHSELLTCDVWCVIQTSHSFMSRLLLYFFFSILCLAFQCKLGEIISLKLEYLKLYFEKEFI